MLRNNRILFFSGSFSDFSMALSDINAQTKTLAYVAGDFLYLGSDLPFNHRYFDVSTPNNVAATLSADYWTGNGWKAFVDVIDETAVNGVPLAQSGIVSWQTNLDESSWGYDDTDEMDGSGLETGPIIYKLFWIRLKWDQTLLNTTALRYIGHRFSDDTDLVAEYPELSSSAIKTAWQAGKTTWNEQCLTAAEYIVQDLRGPKNIIQSADQILDWKNYQKASVHKTAEIIFRGFGDDYKDQMLESHNAYRSALAVGKHNVDLDGDATLSDGEKVTNVTFATR